MKTSLSRAVALAATLASAASAAGVINSTCIKTTGDPYARSVRSKGEKARNKKLRRG